MSHRLKLAACCLVLPLVACTPSDEASDEASDNAAAVEEATVVSPTSTIGRPAEVFEAAQVEPIVTTEIAGQRVKDPAMELSYKWQGTSYAPSGGTVVVVAVTNESDAPMPVDLLRPTLSYNIGGGEMRTAESLTAEAAGVDFVGLDIPLGPGATFNAKYAFNVATGNLWDARFTIGNVTFQGYLNN